MQFFLAQNALEALWQPASARPTEVRYSTPPHPVVAMGCGEGRGKGIGRDGKGEWVREGKEKSGGKEGGEGEGIKALPPHPQWFLKVSAYKDI